jgi:hypothetical protein
LSGSVPPIQRNGEMSGWKGKFQNGPSSHSPTPHVR